MLLYDNQIKDGDVLHCTGSGKISKLIQRALGTHINHTALVIERGGVPFIFDSQKDGSNIRSVEDWNAKYNYDYYISRPMANVFTSEMKEKALSLINEETQTTEIPYDYWSLLFYQPIYLITGKWIGRRGDKAKKKLYCSELVAYIYDVPSFYKYNPKMLYKLFSQSKNFVTFNPIYSL